MKRIGIFVLLIAVFLAMCGCRAGKHPLHQVEEDFERARRGYQEMREAYPRASEEAGKMEQKIKEYEQELEGLDEKGIREPSKVTENSKSEPVFD